ncbi:hypothetical protein NQ315_009432 [Exocentrus adspersus]|uniref:Uncharacterized protein n=1 Tax=Exocentrus adspersus TaxID=1586481 RepID=A0AAV8WGA3_9CUCU|nr:hypothetical protein NQ315_009432 [Exocentrus adspersus]
MSSYDFNPDVCLQVFHGIAEEIPSGVSPGLNSVFKNISFIDILSVIRDPLPFFTRPLLIIAEKNIKKICPKIKFTQELLSYLNNAIVVIVKKALDLVWVNYNIPEKLKRLGEMEEKSPKIDAWRPTTGKVNLNSIIAKNLLQRKAKLIKQMELVREETALITPYLRAFSEQADKQLKEIDQIQQKYITINK